MATVHGGIPPGRARPPPGGGPGARSRAGLPASVLLAGAALLAACGGADASAAEAEADGDPVYDYGLEQVLARGRDARERDALRRAYDVGWEAGAREAAEVDARTEVEARRLGCRELYPVLARTLARDGVEPPPRQVHCRPRAAPEVLDARRRGRRFDRSRDVVVEDARRLDDRRLGYLLVEAQAYGYARGFRRWRGGWDAARSTSLERAGCRDAVARALRTGALSELHEPRLLARCDALGEAVAVGAPAP